MLGKDMFPKLRLFWIIPIFVLLIGVIFLLLSILLSNKTELTTRALSDINMKLSSKMSYDEGKEIKDILAFWQNKSLEANIWTKILHEIGMAFIIAVIIVVIVEYYSRSRLHSDIRDGVIDSMLNRLIPPAIWTEFKDYVLGQKALRKNWTMEMHIEEVTNGNPNEYVSRTTVSYTLDGLTDHEQDFIIAGELDRDVTGTDTNGEELPRYLSIQIGSKIFNESTSNLQQLLKDDAYNFDHEEKVFQGANIPVRIEFKEILRVPDSFVHSVMTLTENMSFKVFATPKLKFSVEALHPDANRLQRIAANHWSFVGGLVGGQGLKIYVEEMQDSE